MLERSPDERITSSACLKDSWFSSLPESQDIKKGQNCLGEMGSPKSIEQTSNFFPVRPVLSLRMEDMSHLFSQGEPLE
jgi:hypothetical protein